MFVPRYEAHYALPLGRKKGAKLTDAEEAVLNKKRSKKTEKKYKERQKDAKVEQGLTDQFMGGERRTVRSHSLEPSKTENIPQVASSPPSPPAPGSAAGPTATSWRGKSWSSTSGRSRPRRGNKAETC